MLVLVLRRARVQRALLVVVAVLVATACTLVGTCTLVLTATQDRAFHRAAQQLPVDDVGVTAFLVDVDGADVVPAADAAAAVVGDVLAPLRPTLETTMTSRLRELGADAVAAGLDADGQAYLAATDALASRADLRSGRWPASTTPSAGAALEAVVPETTARLLDLEVGDEVVLGRELGLGGADDDVRVVLVGTFRPRSGVEWERDPLGGAGFSPDYSDGLEAAATYGPFVVDQRALLTTGSSVNALRVTAHPQTALATEGDLRHAVQELRRAPGALTAQDGDRARLTRVGSELPRALDGVLAQQASTRSTVLVVLLLGVALSMAAALLTGRVVARTRHDERDLLVAMGLGRRQQAGSAAVEAVLVSVVAAAVAVPAAAVLHSRLTHLDALDAAGLTQAPTFSVALVLAVLATALVLSGALVGAATRAPLADDPAPRTRLARVPEVVLLAFAGIAWWQLRSRPATASGADVVLTLAPMLVLGALTVVGVRLVPPLLEVAARATARSPALVWPLASRQARRRAHTATATALVAGAVAAAVLGLSVRSTWERSQVDQAALRVGTDLALTLPGPAGPQEAATVAAAVAAHEPAPPVSPVIHRPLALGRYVGREGARPVLVAVDARSGGELLRGRLDAGRTWSGVTAPLAAPGTVAGLPVPDAGAGMTLRGSRVPGATLRVRPTAVLQDATGFRAAVSADTVTLDGTPHPLRWTAPLGTGLELVALRLEIDGAPTDDPSSSAAGPASHVEVSVSVPAGGPTDGPAGGPTDADAAWRLLRLQDEGPVTSAEVSLDPGAGGTTLRAGLDLSLTYLQYTGADLLATALPAPEDVPVAVSQDLVDAVGAGAGDRLSAIVGDSALVLRVVSVVPAVPSAPGQVAVLADADTLSRALVDSGRLDPVVDGWWVGDPPEETTTALESSGLGTVTTRAAEADRLARGPLRAAVPATLLVLVALAVALQLSAVVLLLGADRARRSTEVARLRAMGASRREVGWIALVEQLLVLVPLMVVGTAVGVATAVLVGPHLVRSDVGAAPVPTPSLAWPWAGEVLVVGGLTLAALGVALVLARALVRRSLPDQLRADGA